jgi:hypothetical protein
VQAKYEADQVVLTLGPDELSRLAAVLAEVTTGASRAEFFIRVGCSLPNIEALIRALEMMASGQSTGFEMKITAGLENEENPPRPRRTSGAD